MKKINSSKNKKMSQIVRSSLYDHGENIVLSSSNQGLDLFSSHDVTEDSHEVVKLCRSVIFSGDNLVNVSFPYTKEYTEDMKDEWKTLFSLKHKLFYPSYEGCIVRVFFEKDQWWYVTNHKLNAFDSHWGSQKSFGEMLLQTCTKEELEASLDKTKQYTFLVRFNSENAMVCLPSSDESPVFHVGTFCVKNGTYTFSPFDTCLIPHPTVLDLKSESDLLEFMYSTSHRKVQGVVCLSGTPTSVDNEWSNLQVFKVYSAPYSRASSLRGSTVDPKTRYIELYQKGSPDELKEYQDQFSEHTETFYEMRNRLQEICQFIYNSYVARYILKQQVVVPPQEFSVMKKCHEWHHQNMVTNKINLSKVEEMLKSQPTDVISRMLFVEKEKRMMKESPIKPKTTSPS